MSKIVLITGASSGFGEACAYKFAENGYHVILNARRKDRLETIATDLNKKFQTKTLLLPFDVSLQEAVSESINNLPDEWKAIDVLINNAGLALGKHSFDDALLSDWNQMVDTNIKGFAYVAQAVSKLMIKQKRGHIINMGSVAGKQVYEKGNMYCATKYAVDALSQAMRIDLLPYNIRVTSINPGAAETEFSLVRFKGDEQAASDVYKGMKALTAEDVAETIFFCTNLPAHVCINDLTISCTQQADVFYYHKEQKA